MRAVQHVAGPPARGAFTQIVALSLTLMVLMGAAVFFPFLEISRMGLGNTTSLFGVAMAYSHGILIPLTVAVLMLIVGLPVLRALLLVYTLLPMAEGGRPLRHAAQAFSISERLRPWSMAEIFVIGTAVAMIKVAGLANVSLGPAFWAFCALIVVGAASNVFTSAAAIWDALEDRGAHTDGREMAPEPPATAPSAGARRMSVFFFERPHRCPGADGAWRQPGRLPGVRSRLAARPQPLRPLRRGAG